MKTWSALILEIKWAEADERIRVEAGNLASTGGAPWEQATFEMWSGKREPVWYRPQATYSSPSRMLRLEYSESDHQGLPPGIPWGISTITFAPDFKSASAHFEGIYQDGSTGSAKIVRVHKEHPSEKKEQLIAARIAQSAFRKRLLQQFDRCALTGESSRVLLEAAHVHEVWLGGPDELENGLLLRVDVHRLFDHNYINISDDGTVLLHEQVPQHIKQQIAKRLDRENLRRIAPHLAQRPPGLRKQLD